MAFFPCWRAVRLDARARECAAVVQHVLGLECVAVHVSGWDGAGRRRNARTKVTCVVLVARSCIAQAESGGNANAVQFLPSDSKNGGSSGCGWGNRGAAMLAVQPSPHRRFCADSYSVGLMQINQNVWAECSNRVAPCTPSSNLDCAVFLYTQANWTAWEDSCAACGAC
jgi:hypothetical protein